MLALIFGKHSGRTARSCDLKMEGGVKLYHFQCVVSVSNMSHFNLHRWINRGCHTWWYHISDNPYASQMKWNAFWSTLIFRKDVKQNPLFTMLAYTIVQQFLESPSLWLSGSIFFFKSVRECSVLPWECTSPIWSVSYIRRMNYHRLEISISLA